MRVMCMTYNERDDDNVDDDGGEEKDTIEWMWTEKFEHDFPMLLIQHNASYKHICEHLFGETNRVYLIPFFHESKNHFWCNILHFPPVPHPHRSRRYCATVCACLSVCTKRSQKCCFSRRSQWIEQKKYFCYKKSVEFFFCFFVIFSSHSECLIFIIYTLYSFRYILIHNNCLT